MDLLLRVLPVTDLGRGTMDYVMADEPKSLEDLSNDLAAEAETLLASLGPDGE